MIRAKVAALVSAGGEVVREEWYTGTRAGRLSATS